MRKKRLQEFRHELYINALDKKGKCVPSQASDVPEGLQISCKHDFGSLRWGANQSAHWAHCKDCGLKRVLYYQNDHGALVTEVPETSGAYSDMGPRLEAGDAIVDTGCRTAVAGCRWHLQHQQRLEQLGLTWETVAQEEHFKFGAGPPVLSRRAFIYPVFTHGGRSWVRISEVGGAAEGCPGLIGPSQMMAGRATLWDAVDASHGVHETHAAQQYQAPRAPAPRDDGRPAAEHWRLVHWGLRGVSPAAPRRPCADGFLRARAR